MTSPVTRHEGGKIYQQRASTSSWCLKLAIAKQCRLHKLIRQRFAFVRFIRWVCAKNQQILLSRETSRLLQCIQSRATALYSTKPGASRLIAVDSSIRSTTRLEAPSSDCTRSPDEISTIGSSTSNWPEQISGEVAAAAAAAHVPTNETCHTVAAGVYLLSLGVHTSAACVGGCLQMFCNNQILLVEPSEMEEGET
ncbi:hypothetical protein F511_30126 [Dorcoceras hygrometricum]|uniref:Uncharacterized protein n=1 Tax=Dorcoceras hygrometricum TaxID=472368 RepID=A0A2Z7A464_9LAMI|nr:hypothetical protein F511_30126 [Dorcoceras hygrometricum]